MSAKHKKAPQPAGTKAGSGQIMTKTPRQQLKAQHDWCYSYLTIWAPEIEDLERFEKAAVGYSPWMTSEERANKEPCGLNFHSLVPIPDQVFKAGYDPTGRNWELEHWGVEQGASSKGDPAKLQGGFDDEVFLDYSFETPSAAPIAFLQNVSKKWPTLTFLLNYDHFPNCFKGIARINAAKVEHYQMEYAEINLIGKEASHA
jgi:hypothetical protein